MAHTHKLVDGVRIELTQEEKNEIALRETAWNNGAFDRAMEDLRQRRNVLLSSSDWTQIADSPLTAEQKYSYAEYRTQLRDLTNGLTTVEDVNSVTWPTKPGA